MATLDEKTYVYSKLNEGAQAQQRLESILRGEKHVFAGETASSESPSVIEAFKVHGITPENVGSLTPEVMEKINSDLKKLSSQNFGAVSEAREAITDMGVASLLRQSKLFDRFDPLGDIRSEYVATPVSDNVAPLVKQYDADAASFQKAFDEYRAKSNDIYKKQARATGTRSQVSEHVFKTQISSNTMTDAQSEALQKLTANAKAENIANWEAIAPTLGLDDRLTKAAEHYVDAAKKEIVLADAAGKLRAEFKSTHGLEGDLYGIPYVKDARGEVIHFDFAQTMTKEESKRAFSEESQLGRSEVSHLAVQPETAPFRAHTAASSDAPHVEDTTAKPIAASTSTRAAKSLDVPHNGDAAIKPDSTLSNVSAAASSDAPHVEDTAARRTSDIPKNLAPEAPSAAAALEEEAGRTGGRGKWVLAAAAATVVVGGAVLAVKNHRNHAERQEARRNDAGPRTPS